MEYEVTLKVRMDEAVTRYGKRDAKVCAKLNSSPFKGKGSISTKSKTKHFERGKVKEVT